MYQRRASPVQSETRRDHSRHATCDRRPSNTELAISNKSSFASNRATRVTTIDRPSTPVGFPRENNEGTESDGEPVSPSYHRALAYEALTRNSRTLVDSSQRKRGIDPRQSQTYPLISHPASASPDPMIRISRRSRAEAREIYERFRWQPQRPAYVLSSRNPEKSDSNDTSLLRSDRHRTQSTPPEQPGRPKTRHGPTIRNGKKHAASSTDLYGTHIKQRDEKSNIRGETPKDAYSLTSQMLNQMVHNDVHSSHTTERWVAQTQQNAYCGNQNTESMRDFSSHSTSRYTSQSNSRTSSTSSRVSRGRRMARTRPSSPSTHSQSSCSSSSVASSSRRSRDVSPSRGAWRSDNPQQERPSFRERARQHLSQNLHLNLRRAGIEPQSSFTVHSVVKTSREYVPRLKAAATPSPSESPLETPTTPVASWSPLETAKPFAMQWRNSVLGLSDNKDELTVGKVEGADNVRLSNRTYRPEDCSTTLEERARRHQKQSYEEMPKGSDIPQTHAKSDRDSISDKSLFLGDKKLSSSASESFFASEWSRLQAQEILTPMRLLNPFQPNSFDAANASTASRSSSLVDEASVAAAASDDRGILPSQSREGSCDSLVIAEGLTESPEQMGSVVLVPISIIAAPSHRPALKRKQGIEALR
ncbi:hypothetical protein Daesc_003921 [Daldinia eschscholtzii]|uniref:Uncharacterized protein n=1 Tax=Daldinia eschscholtzii TaxID=292717 RepID=A0AAX6MMW1_9PEZI